MKKEKNKGEEMLNKTQPADNLTVESNEAIVEQENSAETNQETTSECTTETIQSQPDTEQQVAEWKDKYLRLSAEFDNYRKRTLREKADLIRYSGEGLLNDILPVVDDLERALKNVEVATDLDAVKEGINLIYIKFKDFLTQKGLKEIEALNLPFNTDFHEAITKAPVENKEQAGKNIDVVQKGYLLNDKVVRFAKVVVGE